jgi:DNA topoisomerase-3
MSAEFEITSDGRVECEFDGRKRSFRTELFGHTFDEDEIAELVAGNQVEFDAISKAGKPYRAVVALEEYTFEDKEGNERKAFGPRLDFDAMNARRGVPATWCEHLFTDSEKKTLEAGGKIHLEDCVSKRTGNTFSCDVIFAEENPGEGKRIIPQFAPRK